MTIIDYNPGDVNDDGTINVADVSAAVSIILNEGDDSIEPLAADVNNDGVVNVADVSAIIQMILSTESSKVAAVKHIASRANDVNTSDTFVGEEIEVVPGTETTLMFDLNNEETYVSCQFDIYLPEGLEEIYDDGDIDASLTSERKGKDHQINSRKQSDGALRFVIASLSNKTFKGNSGCLFTLPVKVSESFADDAEVRISGIVFTRQEGNVPMYLADSQFTVSKGASSGVVNIGINDADAEYYNLQGARVVGEPMPGIYVKRVGGKASKVVVK